LIIEGSVKVTARGGSSAKNSIGIQASSIAVTGGTVVAEGGTATNGFSRGLSAESNLTVSGNASVTATAATAGTYSYAMRSGGSLTIADSANVTATGGTGGTAGRGIYAASSISISGTPKIVASGTTSALSRTPSALPSSYKWRTSNSASYTMSNSTAYSYSSSQTYVEIGQPLYITSDATLDISTLTDFTDIIVSGSGTDLTVTGTNSGAFNITFSIGAGASVNWTTANFTSSHANRAVYISGGGTFNMSGGTITETSSTGRGIDNGTSDIRGAYVYISGGTISASGTSNVYGIYNRNGGVAYISGGTITAGYGGIFNRDSASIVNISGGIVTGAKYGIVNGSSATGSMLFITGGIVAATDGRGIFNNDGSVATVSGKGSVIGTTVVASDNVIFSEKAVGFTYSTTNKPYTKETSTDITKHSSAAGATVIWNEADTKSGISWTYGENTGFFEVPGAIEIRRAVYTLYFSITDGLLHQDTADGTVVASGSAELGGGTYSYDSGAKTLALSGVDFNTTMRVALDLTELPTGAIVDFGGANWFVSSYTDANTTSYGIYFSDEEAYTLTGVGSVTATGGDGTSSMGIYSRGSLAITDVEITGIGGTATTSVSRGISAEGLAISGDANITASSGTASGTVSAYSYALRSGKTLTISGNAIVNATGGTGSSGSRGIYGTSIAISGAATVIAKTTDGSDKASAFSKEPVLSLNYTWRLADGETAYNTYPDAAYTYDSAQKYVEIIAIDVPNTLILNEYGLKANTAAGDFDDIIAQDTENEVLGGGSYSWDAERSLLTLNNVQFSGSGQIALNTTRISILAIELNGTNIFTSTAAYNSTDATGIRGISITIQDNTGAFGSLTATGESKGIRVSNTLTINGGTLSFNGTDETNGHGISCMSSNASNIARLRIAGGSVTAAGGKYGVHFYKSTNPYISITGGSLITQGTNAAVTTTNSIIADTTYQYRKSDTGGYTPYTASFMLSAGDTYLEVRPIPAPEVKLSYGRGGDITTDSKGFVYNITPISGYAIDQVFIDGAEQTVTGTDEYSYTFTTQIGLYGFPHTI
jgi:hypothetical protein